MNITEEQKQEAERVYTKYYHIWINSDMLLKVEDFKKLVIQDRQSVLDELKSLFPLQDYNDEVILVSKCKSIMAQIEYLKSKI